MLDTNLLVHCFDAQIWATAKRNRVPAVLSEDFPVGGTVEGVTFVNPLSDAVDLSELQTGVQ